MDFKKIARIFIIAFALLNIYLIVGIFERQDIQYTTAQPTSENIFFNMEALDIDLPEFTEDDSNLEEIYPLQVNEHDFLEVGLEENDALTGSLNEEGTVYYESFPSNPIELEGNPSEGFTDEDYTLLEDFVLSEEVMYGTDYSFGFYDREGRRFVFYQYVDGIPIADGTSEISLYVNESGEIYAYEQTYAGQTTRQGSALQLINGARAVEILFLNNEIRRGADVQAPILTYRRVLHLEDLSMYSPVWLVNVDLASERNIFRVDAVNGTIIRQPIAPTDTPQDSENGNGSENENNGADTENEGDTE